MSYVSEHHKLVAETLKKNFSRRGMDAYYCETAEEAKSQILSMIPEGASVTWAALNP